MRLKLPHLYFTLFTVFFISRFGTLMFVGQLPLKEQKMRLQKICSLLNLFGIVIVILFVIPDTPNGPSLLLGHVL